MGDETEFPKWIDEAFERWNHGFDTTESAILRQKELAQKSVEALTKMDREKLTGWRREWVDWLLSVNQQVANTSENKSINFEEFINEETPAWLEELVEKFSETGMSTVNFKALLQKRPSQSIPLTFGEIIGHEHALWHPDNPGIAASLDKIPAGEVKELRREQLEYQRKLRLQWVYEATAIAMRQSLTEVRQFARGYSLAIQKGTLNETGEFLGETQATKIYTVLFFYSDFVEPNNKHLRTVNELYEWLQMILGTDTLEEINGFKRVEKICERIKLRYGDPGRPRAV